MKKCSRCGEENPDNKIWCISCGEPLPAFSGEATDDDLLSGLHGDWGNHASGIPHSESTDENHWNRGGTAPNGVTYCGYCGKPMMAGVRYCPHCGHRREGTVANSSRKPRFWRWAALLAALAVLVSLIGSILFAFGNTKTTEASATPKATEACQDAASTEHHYQVFHNVLTWQEAKRACEAMGGHLATVTSAKEQKTLEALNLQNENLWIGANCDSGGNWAWVTGESWEYTNWNDGEPNNSSNVMPAESCAAIWPDGWNDLASGNLYEQSGYICEWDAVDPAAMIQVPLPDSFSCITVSVGIADWRIMPEDDGSFDGSFGVWNWGDNGPDFPMGTCSIINMTGVFSQVQKVSDYSYKMIVDKAEKTQQAGETYLSDGGRYVVEDGMGIIDDGSEFYLYLPGVPLSELPQGLIDSVSQNGGHSMSEITLDTYILYNSYPEYNLVFIGTLEKNDLQGQSAAEADRQLASLTTYTEDSAVWYRHLFSWDENGRLIRVQDVTDWNNVRTWTFQYNERGQLLRQDQSSADYSFVCQENTYSADGKLLSSRSATEDSYEESTYQYDSSGRLFKVIQTDDYYRRDTTVTEYNGEGKPTREERVETVLSTGEQSRATEQIEYDELGRETKWRYSGTDGEYGMTYRYDIKPFAICTYETGGYTLLLENEDGTSSWTIDVGVHYTPLEENGVLNFQNANADIGTLEADADGYLTRISYKDGAYFEFEYSSSAENGTE